MWFLRRRKTEKLIVEAAEALEDAKKNLNKVNRRGPEVRRVSGALRDFRERNHFIEEIESIFLLKGQP
jgi:hypothetical protein